MSLQEGRCNRWSDEIAELDCTHSSRRAWNLLRKLGGATHSKRQQPKVTANEIAHQLLLNVSVKKERRQANTYRNNSATHCLTAQKRQICSKLSPPMKIINALKATKVGKAAGQDGIFPDMLKKIGPAAVRWLQAFYDYVMTTANIPQIWRSANVLAILEPGKPIDGPTSYRPAQDRRCADRHERCV